MNLLTREVHVQNADVIPDFCDKTQKKEADFFNQPLSVSINLSARWQISKKEGIFCQFKLVGVRWYGRV